MKNEVSESKTIQLLLQEVDSEREQSWVKWNFAWRFEFSLRRYRSRTEVAGDFSSISNDTFAVEKMKIVERKWTHNTIPIVNWGQTSVGRVKWVNWQWLNEWNIEGEKKNQLKKLKLYKNWMEPYCSFPNKFQIFIFTRNITNWNWICCHVWTASKKLPRLQFLLTLFGQIRVWYVYEHVNDSFNFSAHFHYLMTHND